MKLRIFLVFFSCLVSLITGLVLSRGQLGDSPAAERKRLLIGLSLDTLKEERWQHDRDLFVARVRALGAESLVQAANSDDTRQITDVEALISRKVDILVIAPHNGAAMAKAVRLAHDAGIPVIAYDRLITDCDLDLYISFDAVKVGEMQALFITQNAPSEGTLRVVRINGAKTDHNAVLVRQGQDRVLEPYVRQGKISLVHDDWAENWKPENAKKIMAAAITRVGRDFEAVLAANDGTAGGAVQALLEEGLAGKILVTGQDAELAACQRIVNGTQTMTIYKPLKTLAELAAETAVKMASAKPVIADSSIDNGKIKVPAILIPVVVATKDNMRQTVLRDGFQKPEEVYRGSTERDLPPRGPS